ncbi:TonB-dependent receptor [Mucilaginibacter sp. KACC 22773]|uniref:TonB-dependent receptor n=1 Tax=Mucilaginibacter sp. KACC 22773 TaxID=3025671 RepID=UPI00236723E5|nr:TonB-dependent receptor [Mucilaginibacter sp. KACC 22773]WDF77107.1 TonB-dependent receptor [Mucilaginibacter sp. KACC 22773]
MRKSIHILIFLLSVLAAQAQKKVTISGTITSGEKAEGVESATVMAGNIGAVSNRNGYYSISLPKGNFQIRFSAVGLQSTSVQVSLKADTVINVGLPADDKKLDEVTIFANSNRRSLENPQMGVEKLSVKQMNKIPVFMGERDVLKTIQLLPGIKSAGDGNSGLYVRGGAADQNLILLDDAPIYNASHVFGFFSTFNSDAIKDLAVYKGGMPAQYGGRLSSVIDVKMNDGDNQDFHVAGGIGLISSRLNVEGPIQKGKSSFLISGRRTYVDAFLRLSGDSTINRNTIYFYDINAKITYDLGKKDKLYFSLYNGSDRLGITNNFLVNWGNTASTLRWSHSYNNRLFANTSLIYSNYDYNIQVQQGVNDVNLFSQIRDFNIKHELQWYLYPDHELRIGVNAIHHTVRPGEVTASDRSSYNNTILQRRYSWENAAYIADTWKISPKFNINYGARLTAFSILGAGDFFNIDPDGRVTDTLSYRSGQVVKTYLNLEPRAAASCQLNGQSSVKLSYARNVQNLHLISNSTTATPTDKWIASTNIVKPEIADQFSLGYYRDLSAGKYELTVETYYKNMQNQIDYRDGADVLNGQNNIESQLLFGKGRAYGLEMQLKKQTGPITGWISYTLSKTEKQIIGINNNQWYDARQDRTHEIAVVGMYQISPKWELSASWTYYTGNAVSFPSGKYTVNDRVYFYYTERNGYRMPAYHRLDIGATKKLKQTKKYSSELTLSLYNAYGRENPYTIEFETADNDPNRTVVNQTTLFRFVPSIAYNFKF